MSKIIELSDRWIFHCEACGKNHAFNNTWDFNRDLDKPTVMPSILVTMYDKDVKSICHSFIKNGVIEYLSDCTHKYAGQSLELKDY